MNLKNPVTLSFIGFVTITILSILILWIWKPNVVLKVKTEKDINWGKLISLSIIMGVVVAIILFFTTIKKIDFLTKEKYTMGFFNKSNHCY